MSRGSLHRAGAVCAGVALATALTVSTATASPAIDQRLDRAAAPVSQLREVASVPTPRRGDIVRYRQQAGGLPVLDAEVVVADPAGSAPQVVADTSVPDIEPVDPQPTLDRAAAVRVAAGHTPLVRGRGTAAAELGIDGDSGRLAWEVLVPSAQPLGDYLVVLDAHTGEKLRPTRDLLWNATGAAALFDPNPVVAQGGYSGLRDARDKDSPRLTSLRTPVELPRITSSKGCLTGTYADARLGRKAERVCRTDLDFTGLTRSANAFEAVMAYYHVDRTRAYVDSLGLSKALRRKPQKIRANGIPDDNSYYSSRSRAMTLGTGGVDDGEDADVIVHEYGHSLQDQAVPGFGRSVAAGAIGEGFGDYLAAAMSNLRTGGSEFDTCIFDWDGVSYSRIGCGRQADKGIDIKQAKRRCMLQIHCMGEAWSSALFELRTALGNDPAGLSIMDRVVLESNFMLPRATSFREAARAVLAADRLLYGGVHVGVLEAELVQRRFCPKRGC